MVNLQNMPSHISLQPLRNERLNRIYLAFEEGCRTIRLSWFYILVLGALEYLLVGLVFSLQGENFGGFMAMGCLLILVAAAGWVYLLYTLAGMHLWTSGFRLELRMTDIAESVDSDASQMETVEKLGNNIQPMRRTAHLLTGWIVIGGLIYATPKILDELDLEPDWLGSLTTGDESHLWIGHPRHRGCTRPPLAG